MSNESIEVIVDSLLGARYAILEFPSRPLYRSPVASLIVGTAPADKPPPRSGGRVLERVPLELGQRQEVEE